MQQPADTTDLLTHPSNTSVASETMLSVFGMMPHSGKEQVISHIITLSKEYCCAPLLLVRPTGGGKSAMRDTVGVLLAGIVLTISPLLSLAADQNDKVGRRASQQFGNVLSFHLNEIKDTNEQQAVAASISKPSIDTTQTVFLFASPQVLFVNREETPGFDNPKEVIEICGS
jgi:superfamily II DNA helicase RecQ